LVLSHEISNKRSGIVIAVALTTQPQRTEFPVTLELDLCSLPKKSWVKISQIRILSVECPGRRLAPETIDGVVEGLNQIIG